MMPMPLLSMPVVRVLLVTVVATAVAACAGTNAGARAADRAAAERAAREAVARERSIDAASLPPRTVSVAPLQIAVADTSLAPLGYALADLLLTDLAQSRQLTVVERLRLDAVLRELQLATSGAVDRASAPRVGRLVGARRIVVGRLAERRAGELTIDLTVADAANAQVATVSPAIARAADAIEAEKALAFRLFDRLGVTLAPSERAAVEQRQTQNLGALLAYGRAVRYEVWGRYDLAAREYAEAARRDPGFGLARTRAEAARNSTTTTLAGGSLTRAAAAAAGAVNGGIATPLSGSTRPGTASDPAFLAATATIFVTISTPR